MGKAIQGKSGQVHASMRQWEILISSLPLHNSFFSVPSGYGFVAVPQVRTQLVLRSRDFAHPDPWHRRPVQAPGIPVPETSSSAPPYSHGPGVKILVP